jgi:hypothetical protein
MGAPPSRTSRPPRGEVVLVVPDIPGKKAQREELAAGVSRLLSAARPLTTNLTGLGPIARLEFRAGPAGYEKGVVDRVGAALWELGAEPPAQLVADHVTPAFAAGLPALPLWNAYGGAFLGHVAEEAGLDYKGRAVTAGTVLRDYAAAPPNPAAAARLGALLGTMYGEAAAAWHERRPLGARPPRGPQNVGRGEN